MAASARRRWPTSFTLILTAPTSFVTLSDWASVQPYYDPAKGETPNQKTYPAAFEAPARDANLLTEYDRGHDFSLEGSTKAS